MKLLKTITFVVIELLLFNSLCSGYVLSHSEKALKVESNILGKGNEDKYVLTEKEAWQYFGVEACADGPGMQCFFHGTVHSHCFDETNFICDGITDCQCENDQDLCLTDEAPSVCAWKDIIHDVRKEGIPNLGYGMESHKIFLILWMTGLQKYCPADEHGINKLRCHSDPSVCVSVDELCDGRHQCESMCDTLYGSDGEKCPGDESFLSCGIKDTLSMLLNDDILEEYERKSDISATENIKMTSSPPTSIDLRVK